MFGIYIDYTSSVRLLWGATSPDIVLKQDHIELNRSFQYIFPIPSNIQCERVLPCIYDK